MGDVAILAARIVGTAGSVTACDLDEKALAVDTLEERLRAEGVASGAVTPAPTMVGAVGRRSLRGLPNVSRVRNELHQ